MLRRKSAAQLKDQKGQTMTEFALVLPILALLLFAVIQCGIAFNNYLTVTDAARAAARKGAVSMYGGGNPSSAATAAARASAQNLDQSKFQVAVAAAPRWEKGADVIVTTSYPYEISLLGLVVKSGRVTSSTRERIE
jgi:Flp pilus assembly protein TadG